MKFIKEELLKLKEENLFREIKNIDKIEGKFVYINNKKYLDFSSSNYLGLRDNEDIKEEVIKAVEKYGFGSGASRLVVGTNELYDKLEKLMSKIKKQEKTLFFNSGYDANLGVINTLFGKNDIIFCDKLNHASIYDGIFMSGAKLVRYKHNNMKDLEKKLLKYRKEYKNSLIITDTIFSMDGDRANLIKLVDLKKSFDSILMIDEAHGGGIIGENGGGLAQEKGVLEEIDINMGTFSKAYGGQGAYVSSKRDIIDYLINKCRSLIYTTSLPPSVVAGNIKAVQMGEKDSFRRQKVEENSKYLRKELAKKGYNIGESTSHIIPIILDSNDEAVEKSRGLFAKGIILPAIRKPTVIEPRLRISLGYLIEKEDIDKILELL